MAGAASSVYHEISSAIQQFQPFVSAEGSPCIFHVITRLLHKPIYKAGIASFGLNRNAHLLQFQKPKQPVPSKTQK